MAGKILIGNDHLLYLIGVRDARDFSFVTTATASASVLDAPEGSVITGGGPVSLALINIGTDTVGGEVANPTIVKSVDGFDVVVTVGATAGLDLAAGRLLSVLHDAHVWQLRRDAVGAADSDVTLHLEPLFWPGQSRPRKVKMEDGEILEIEDGSYVGTLDAAFSVENEEVYNVQYTAEEGGREGQWDEDVDAEYRTG